MSIRWKHWNLGDLCEIVGGGTPSKNNPAYYSGSIPWATVRDMRQEIITETERKITKEAVRSSATNIIPSGNVVIATRVGLGKVCLLGQDTAINQDLRGVVPRNSKTLIVRFLYWWLKSISNVVVAQGTGATVQGVKLPFIKSLQIPLPPLLEQQRIVDLLDVALAKIERAKAHTDQNQTNAATLFKSHLHSVFTRRGARWTERTLREVAQEFGRGKSKHRPRGDPKLLGGMYPLIQTGDIANARQRITSYTQTYNEFGLAQSKLWPRGTVCIAIVGANVAETAILDFDACFPDSVIGLVVDQRHADPEYVHFLLSAFKAELKAKGKGTARDNINIATFENQRFPFPSVAEQKAVVAKITSLYAETQRLGSIYARKLVALDKLKDSLLTQAFAGELLKERSKEMIISLPTTIVGVSTTDLHAGLLAIAFDAHEKKGKLSTFGHVKAEKFAHMVESYIGLNLGRTPVKDAAGPNDFPHLHKVEHRARMAAFFDFKHVADTAYQVKKLGQFDKLVERTKAALADRLKDVSELLDLMVPMTTQQAEVFSTVYAAWNNLLQDKGVASDDEIVSEARENWHPAKLAIPREKFVAAIDWLRRKNMVPTGNGKRVEAKQPT